MNTIPELSICITSYNRPNELIRCLKSIDCIDFINNIEIIVSEDCSPQRELIIEKVNAYKDNTQFKVHLNLNTTNLGYDGNLTQLISLASGKYILLMSDDDSFIDGALCKILEFLKGKNYGVIFSPFKLEGGMKRKYKKEHIIKHSIKNAASYLYDSILFSGLIFKRDYIYLYSADRFLNLNYFQVFLFLSVLSKYDGYYVDIPLINCIGDGDNAYGIAESNEKNPYLANRKSIFSNLEFHKGLVNVIRLFESDNNVNIMSIFAKEYSLRTYYGLAKAKKSKVKNDFKEYWNKLNKLDIPLTKIVIFYYWALKLLGVECCNVLLACPCKIFIKFKEIKYR